MDDHRLEIRRVAEETRSLITQERELSLRIVLNIAALEGWNAERNMGPIQGRIWDFLGLTEAQYWKRCQMARTITNYPILQEWVAVGDVSLSHVAMVAGKITPANSALVLSAMREKSTRELSLLLSRVTSQGELRAAEEVCEVTLRLTRPQLELLERCREVLAHGGKVPASEAILEEAMKDLLNKRDKLAKAERSAARQEKVGKEVVKTAALKQGIHPHVPTSAAGIVEARRRGVAALAKHATWLKSGGQCMHVHPDGERCRAKMMLEIDHIHMRCRGGGHEAGNLRLVCRRHNQQYARDRLGEAFMTRARLASSPARSASGILRLDYHVETGIN